MGVGGPYAARAPLSQGPGPVIVTNRTEWVEPTAQALGTEKGSSSLGCLRPPRSECQNQHHNS